MGTVMTIARRELGAYFGSYLAYAVVALFLFINGIFFILNIVFSQSATIRPVIQTIYTILLLIAPMLTMRLISEELRTSTIELLLTAPVREIEVVAGKYLAGLGFVGVMLGMTLVYPAILFAFGAPDVGVTVGGYLGIVLLGSAVVSIGLLASSVTPNQIVSAVITFAVLLALWVMDGLGNAIGGKAGAVVSYIALYPHFNDLTRGLINTKDIIYYVSLAGVGVFLSTMALEARRWRG